MSAAPPPLPPFQLQDCLVGANPIIWSNDDFADLAGDVPLATILSEMRAAGYSGTELGHAYPRAAGPLAESLSQYDLRLATGWHSTYLASRSLGDEERALQAHLRLLKTLGARVAIVAECTHCIHGRPEAPLGLPGHATPRLNETEWNHLVGGLHHLAALAAQHEVQLVYHHHMGTVIQEEHDLERLLSAVPELGLVLDAGHLAFAGMDPVVVARRHAHRIAHVHLKSVRAEVVERARQERWSFHRAVANGVFTIAGEGAVDYPALFALLATIRYRGWLIVEAEEDPAQVPALPKARRARDFVRQQVGV